MNKISIIIPVYNEKDTFINIIEKVESTDFNMEKEIIIVDDCSNDGTKDLYNNIKHKIIYHDKNMGKGAALRTGIKAVTGDIIIIQDADLEYNPNDYIPLVNVIKDGQADVVYGSRFLNNKNNKNFLLLSFLANKTLTFITKILYGNNITDMETCYKAFRSDIIKNINIESDRFDFEPEITAKIFKKGVKFKELPISYNARTVDEGKKINWHDGLQAIFTLIKYKFKQWFYKL